MCGGTVAAVTSVGVGEGLSPRVRGNPAVLHDGGQADGSIPACAGEPGLWPPPGSAPQVYPRVCGGTLISEAREGYVTGLSPRVRGNQSRALVHARIVGSIPACAGEPPPAISPNSFRKVYPRVCGGTSGIHAWRHGKMGLSPRVRGNHCRMNRADVRRRSIPACAGEPDNLQSHLATPEVYPRVCGGTPVLTCVTVSMRGLSPRVRGNLHSRRRQASPRGSIPACAGEPLISRGRIQAAKVYPRVCGGTLRPRRKNTVHDGLSPRVRGNRGSERAYLHRTGSIPACAGEPSGMSATAVQRQVYPRVCGGTAPK